MTLEEKIAENLAALREVGIINQKAKNLSRLPWVTKEYIQAHIQAVTGEGGKIGLAVWRMERGIYYA